MTEEKTDFEAYELPEPPSSLVDEIVSQADAVGATEPGRRSAWLRVAGGVVALAAAAVLLLVFLGGDERSKDERASMDAPGDKVIKDRSSEPRVPIQATDHKLVRVLPSASAREALARAISSARSKRLAAGAAPASAAGGTPAGGGNAVLGRETIKRAMSEIRPLLVECYEMALEGDAGLAGKVTAKFHIVAEPDVGGLVADVELASKDGLLLTDDPAIESEFAVCLRETIASLELPAPTGGGEMWVNYPFVFRSGADAGSAAASPADAPRPSHRLPSKEDDPYAGQDISPLGQAKLAAKEGRYADAIKWCSLKLDRSPRDQEAAMVCVLAACHLQNAADARRYLGILSSRSRRDMASQICLQNGIELTPR